MQARLVVSAVIGAAVVGIAAAWWLRESANVGGEFDPEAVGGEDFTDLSKSPRATDLASPPLAPRPPRAAPAVGGAPPVPSPPVPRTPGAPSTAAGLPDAVGTGATAGAAGALDQVSADGAAPADPGPILRPRAWLLGAYGCPGYELRSDATVAWSGAWSARLVGDEDVDLQTFCPLLQVISAAEFAGRRVEFVVHLRTEGAPVYATSWIRANDIQGLTVAFDNALVPGRRAPRLDSPWTRQVIVVDVPASAAVLTFGAYLKGPGSLWVDSSSLRAVDAATPLSRSRPLTFNSTVRAIDPSTVPPTPQNPDFEDVVEAPRQRPRSQ